MYEEWASTVDGQDADACWRKTLEPLERLVAVSKRYYFHTFPFKGQPHHNHHNCDHRLSPLCSDKERLVEYAQRLLHAYEMTDRLEGIIGMLNLLLSPALVSLSDQSRRDLLDRLIASEERQESIRIEREVQARRYRLGADPPVVLRDRVTSELVNQTSLEKLMMERLALDDVDNADSIPPIVAKVIDRFMRKIPLAGDEKTRTELRDQLLSFAKQYEQQSGAARNIILDFADWDDIWKAGIETGAEGEARNKERTVPDSNVEISQGTLVFSKLQQLTVAWREHNICATRKYLAEVRTGINYLANSYSFALPKVEAQLERIEGLLLVAESNYSQAIPILSRWSDNAQDWEMMRALATAYTATNAHAQAIKIYQRIIQGSSLTEKMSMEVHAELGWLYHLMGDHLEACSLLQTALDIRKGLQTTMEHSDSGERGEPLLSLIHCRLGIIKAQLGPGDDEVAYGHFVEACRADPGHAEPFYHLGQYYLRREGTAGEQLTDLVRAEKCLFKACSLQPTHLNAALSLARLWIEHAPREGDMRTDRLHRTISLLEPHIEAENSFSTLSLNHYLAVAYEGVGRWHEACAAYHRALKSEGCITDRSVLLLGLGRTYHQMGNLFAARQTLEHLLAGNDGVQPKQTQDSHDNDSAALMTAVSVALALVQFDLGEYVLSRKTLASLSDRAIPTNVSTFVQLQNLRAGYHQVCRLLANGCLLAAVDLTKELIRMFESWGGDIDIDAGSPQKSSPLSAPTSTIGISLPMLRMLADTILTLLNWASRTEEIAKLDVSGLVRFLQRQLPKVFDNEMWQFIEGLLASPANPIYPHQPEHGNPSDLVRAVCLVHLSIIMGSEDEPLVMASSWCDLAATLLIGRRSAVITARDELHEAVVEFCQESLRILPTPQAHLVKGVAHLQVDEWALAQDAFIRALPTLPAAWLNLALLYGHVGHPNLAHAALARILVEEAPEVTARAGGRVQVSANPDGSLLAQAWLYKAALERLDIESHNRQSYTTKVRQAALLLPPIYNDHVYGLALACCHPGRLVRDDDGQEGEANWWAQCRLAYSPKDSTAREQLLGSGSKREGMLPHPVSPEIAACGKFILEGSPETLMAARQQLTDFSLASPVTGTGAADANVDMIDDRTWLLAASRLLMTDPSPILVLTECLDSIARRGPSRTSLQAWQDLLFFHTLIREGMVQEVEEIQKAATSTSEPATLLSREKDEIRDLLKDWMRLRLTPEVVRHIHRASVAEIIIRIFADLDADVKTILEDTIAFARDMRARGLATTI